MSTFASSDGGAHLSHQEDGDNLDTSGVINKHDTREYGYVDEITATYRNPLKEGEGIALDNQVGQPFAVLTVTDADN